MDLSTVKKKLNLNVYSDVRAWMADMELIFFNCKIYNGTESEVGRIGVECKNTLSKLLNLYKIQEKFDNTTNSAPKPEQPQMVATPVQPVQYVQPPVV